MPPRKLLPFRAKPILQAYSSHAKALAILSADDSYLPWFYSNYIYLACKKDFRTFEGVPLDFCIDIRHGFNYYLNNPCLFVQAVHKEVIDIAGGDIVDFIVRCIDRDYYVDLYLNEYFVPDRLSFGIEYFYPGLRHFFHDNLIVGYDLEEGCFDLLGHDPRFVHTRISFEQFREAYWHCRPESWHKCMFLYRLEKERDGYSGAAYRFDARLVRESLASFLASDDISGRYAMLRNPTNEFAYGMSAYDSLIANFETGQHGEDLRPLQLLYEHKVCMTRRVGYMRDRGYLSGSGLDGLAESFGEIETMAETLRNAQIRMAMRRRTDMAFIGPRLKEIAEAEKTALSRLIPLIRVP